MLKKILEQVLHKKSTLRRGFEGLEDWLLHVPMAQMGSQKIFTNLQTEKKMVEVHGYSLDSHEVTTSDGYILTLLRVPNPNQNPKPSTSNKTETVAVVTEDENSNQEDENEEVIKPFTRSTRPAVLIVHGFQCSAADWFANAQDKILPFRLANEGYDVFVANLRGTPMSRNHVTLNTKSKKYWDFGFHEMSLFDVPAMINYILEKTGNPSLFYIAHSMGCSIFFAGMSLQPEYCSKVELMVALAPAVNADHFPNKPIRYVIAPLANFLGKIKRARQMQAFHKPMAGYAKVICPPFKKKLGGWLARRYGILFGGIGTEQIEKDRIEKIAGHWPSTMSVKTMCHGMQCVYRKSFCEYDYGRTENVKRYGQPNPPSYDLSKVSTSVVTFHAKDDQLCSSQDVTKLSADLPNVIGNFGISQSKFTHGDFIFGKDADTLVYQQVIDIFRKSKSGAAISTDLNVEMDFVTRL